VNTLSLYELNSLVRLTIEQTLNREYWVEAELAEARESRGHCYMELVQKEEGSNTPIARASAKCWRSSWMMIQPHFERVTGQRLHAGMKVRLKVYAQFHEAYGFSWIVTDIDPTFTLGDLARRRQEIIRQLKQEGVFDLQRELQLPLFCLRIAVISSEGAAGYGDFCKQLNESKFAFAAQLFPAVMQGEQTEASIIEALNQIYKSLECRVKSGEFATASESGEWRVESGEFATASESGEWRVKSGEFATAPESGEWRVESGEFATASEGAGQGDAVANSTLYTLHSTLNFDCVVIIRGGGATADMSGFDTLALAENVAQFPLPIITGIGHDRDECVLDMVSHLRVKTPTAAADILINHAQQVLDRIEDNEQRIVLASQNQLSTLNAQLSMLSQRIPPLFSLVRTREEARTQQLLQRMEKACDSRLIRSEAKLSTLSSLLSTLNAQFIVSHRHRLELLSQRLLALDPQRILDRGYSLTLHQGKAVRNASALQAGDELQTRLAEGTVTSVVTYVAMP